MYNKADQRIEQYATVLLDKAYQDITGDRFSPWLYATRAEDGDESVPDLAYQEMVFPFPYGKGWTNWWFTTTCDLSGLTGNVFLELFTETDTMVYIDKKSEAATNIFHKLVRVNEFLGKSHILHLEAWDGHEFPGYHPDEKHRVLTTVAVKKQSYPLVFEKPRILLRDEDTFTLAYDVKTLSGVLKCLDKDSFAYQHLTASLHNILMGIDIENDDRDAFATQVKTARERIKPLLEAHNGTFAPEVLSVGNAHLDNAWLWPVKETIRKAARTSLNMTGFASVYPEFHFLFTQPFQMRELKKKYPSVFARILDSFHRGQWEPNGVTFIEPDGNLPSGESFIRQCIVGRRLTRELFEGYEGDTIWLPDSFGYSAALPQILTGCGIKYFVTSKLSWNDTTRFPYDIFTWEGLDGSRIPCHMIQGAYEGTAEPEDVHLAYQKVQDKSIQRLLLRSVGEGDGGGGTMEADLEFMKREQNLQGIPKNSWTTLSEAMHRIFDGRDDLPIYKGELYLELHRGTYTGQARIKQYNRRLESLLHIAEYKNAIAYAHHREKAEDAGIIKDVWENVLLNQFHDVLPGSSIEQVNEEAEASYARGEQQLQKLLSCRGDALLNASPYAYPLPNGKELQSYGTTEQDSPTERLRWDAVTVGKDGQIHSLMVAGRELVAQGKAMNTLVFGEEYPLKWDAWDLEKDSLDKLAWIGEPITQERHEDEETRTITSEYRLSARSSLSQKIIIYKAFARIDFVTEVDWHESHRMLRVQFPTNMVSDNAYFDSSFGYIERSLHHDYPHQKAMFEMPGHMWAAMKDQRLAIALASDSKYGYGADEETGLSLSLLTAGKAPDPHADQGRHTFTYSFIASAGDLETIMQHAFALNMPPVRSNLSLPLCTLSPSSVVIETVKVAEDGQGLIFRLRETVGIPETITLSFDPSLSCDTMVRTDMLERPVEDPEPLEFHPFEIKTYRIQRC